MRTCTFAGHACVYSTYVRQQLEAEIEAFISGTDPAVFYVGGRGDFDRMASAAVRTIKERYRDKKIQLYLVEPYMREGLNRDKDHNKMLYDGVIIPHELLGIHPKAAITKRNRWMVDQSDLLIAFVQRDFGGAYEMLKYARRKNVTVVNIFSGKSV